MKNLNSPASLRRLVFGEYQTLGQVYGPAAFGLIIPNDASKVGNDVNQSYVDGIIDIYLDRLAEDFGGFTSFATVGGWINHEGKLITESSITVIAYSAKASLSQVSYIETYAKQIKHHLYQDCVSAIAYGHVYLVDKAF